MKTLLALLFSVKKEPKFPFCDLKWKKEPQKLKVKKHLNKCHFILF
jgi:ABC-type antimicrobial peptide transport system ATPase subunit